MHRMYKMWCTENGHQIQENYAFYKRTFATRFNLKIHKPKKDVCNFCSVYTNTPEQARSDEEISNYQKHQKEKEIARACKSSLKGAGKQLEKTVVAAFDFEKTLLSIWASLIFLLFAKT